jgi:hypothetical protein
MPLTVPCPECGTKLLAPDSAVGQRLRCPKCGTLATVPDLLPAQEVDVVEAKAVAPPPRPKPVQAEAADDEDERPTKRSRRDEDDEEEDRPRKKKRPRYVDDDDYDHDRTRKKLRRRAAGGGGGSGALIAGVVIVGLLMLAASGFAVYFFFGKGKPTPLVKRAPVPPGWSQFSYPQDGFKVYLPKQPSYTSVPAEFLRRDEAPGGFAGRGPFGLGRGNVGGELADAERFTMVQSGMEWSDPVRAELVVFKFRDKVPLSIRDRFRTVAREGNVEGVPVRTVLWLGGDALEQTYPNGVVRVMYTDRYFVVAAIAGRNGNRPKSEEEAGFFDNIELLD